MTPSEPVTNLKAYALFAIRREHFDARPNPWMSFPEQRRCIGEALVITRKEFIGAHAGPHFCDAA